MSSQSNAKCSHHNKLGVHIFVEVQRYNQRVLMNLRNLQLGPYWDIIQHLSRGVLSTGGTVLAEVESTGVL